METSEFHVALEVVREVEKVALLALALSRPPHAFPTDDSSLLGLVGRMNSAGDVANSLAVSTGAPKVTSGDSDWPEVGLALSDGSLMLNTGEGAFQFRVVAKLDAMGNLGVEVIARGHAFRKNSHTHRPFQCECFDAESLLVRAGLLIMASPSGAATEDADLLELAKLIETKLKIRVLVIERDALEKLKSDRLVACMKEGMDVLEVGPSEESRIQLRSCMDGQLRSAWLTANGDLVELGTEIFLGPKGG